MAPRKWIDKKNATTFALVHRAQNDPLINDADAPAMVFAELERPAGKAAQPGSSKVRQGGDLEDEFGMNIRPNEGEAAEHGIFYDDTKYDYMQHMRDIGTGGGQAMWVPAKQETTKGKNKQSLADALKFMDIADDDGSRSIASSQATSKSLLPEELLGSEFVKKTTYQDQQDIPDAIAGFQPNMDPRLREALEALEDEAYVNDDEEDFFAELAKSGEEVDKDGWEAAGWQDEDDDEGWESDATIKADDKNKPSPRASLSAHADENGDLAPPTEDITAAPPADPTGGAWMEEFAKFKQAVKDAKAPPKKQGVTPSEAGQTINTGLSSLASGRRKKRKGAMTNPSAYSMSSSALARTDAQTLLDQRFDKIEEEYANDDYDDFYNDESSQFDDAESLASGMTGLSKASGMSKMSAMSGMSRASGISTYSRATDSEAPELVRSDFDSIMDGFLAGHSRQAGKGRRIKKAGFQTGMEQLDEIRFGLGGARLTGKSKAGLGR
ncbi:hypothetical protein AAFC00_003472 [Neodothiora populina]|uniref:Low temperature viability protein n=1 Tax=Neodothiora populina TaxID=2781224 RepID=A0ABR3PE99_9PEZI